MENKILEYRIFKTGKVKAFTTFKNTIPKNCNARFTGVADWQVKNNRKMLAQIVGLGLGQLVFPRQTHSSNVAAVHQVPYEGAENTDALITNQPDICLCIQTADCVPVLLYDSVNRVVAAIHAGWRGTVGLIVSETIKEMNIRYGSWPGDILAAIGPSIGPGSYQVGKDVISAALSKVPNAEKAIIQTAGGNYFFNLWEANRQVLLKCGVSSSNIEISGHCTFSNPDLYFSARREGISTGRLVSGIMLQAGMLFNKP